jgi:hypothetical protein
MKEISLPAQQQLECYNKRDLEGFMNCYSSTCYVEDGEGNVLMPNKDKMRERYSALFEASPELHCDLVSRIALGQYVIDEEHVTGHNGSKDTNHVVAVYRIEDGLIQHVRFLR